MTAESAPEPPVDNEISTAPTYEIDVERAAEVFWDAYMRAHVELADTPCRYISWSEVDDTTRREHRHAVIALLNYIRALALDAAEAIRAARS